MSTVQMERVALRPWAGNPRKKFGKEKLRELAESLRSQGQLQNLLVRPLSAEQLAGRSLQEIEDGVMHEIILGERRWRAAEPAGMTTMMCIEREVSDKEAAAMSVMENTHRADLDVEEEASGYKRMMEEGWEIVEIVEMTGKPAAFLYEMLDLLKLDRKTLRELSDGTISRRTAQYLGRISSLEARHHALVRIVNEGGAPLAGKVALEVIKNDYLAKQNRQEKWDKQGKKMAAAWPGARVVSVEESYKYLGVGSGWVATGSRPEEHELAVHLRGRDAGTVPTWGELGMKHGAPVAVAPDENGDAVGLVEKGPLEAAERRAAEEAAGKLAEAERKPLAPMERMEAEKAVEGCVFAISGGPGRHEQSQIRKGQVEREKAEGRRRAESVQRMQTVLLRHLQRGLLLEADPSKAPDDQETTEELQVETGLPGAVRWLFDEEDVGDDLLPWLLELLGIDAAALDPEGTGDVHAGAEEWMVQRTVESGHYAVVFLMLSLGIGSVHPEDEGEERLRKLGGILGVRVDEEEED